MARGLADITSKLANLREALPEENVKRIAGFRAEKWYRLADKLENLEPKSQETIDAYRQRADAWSKVAES